MNRRYFHWYLWFILSLLFSPGIHQPCVIFNGHISFSRTSSLLSKCKLPASHSLTVLRRRMKFLCYVNRWQWQNVFLMLQVIHLLLSWGPRQLWGNILLLSIYWEAFGLKTLCTLHDLPVGQLVTYFLLIQLHICEHLHGQCCRDKTVGYGIRETGTWKLTSLGLSCHKMEIIRISQAQYGDEANSQKSSAMPHTW